MSEPLRILIVEDNQDDAELVIAALEHEGRVCQWQRVDTAPRFVNALEEHSWDVVLADYALPGFDGIQALRILKDRNQDIPFILISGYLSEEDAVQALREGAHDFINKQVMGRLGPAVERELREAHNRRERRAAQRALLASQRLLKGIARSLGEGVFAADALGRFQFINPEAARLLGWTEAEVVNQSVYEIIRFRRTGGAVIPPWECGVQSVFTDRTTYRSEDEFFTQRDGRIFPVAYVATPLEQDGAVVGVVVAFQDITERRRREWELENSRERLRELTRHIEAVREDERARIARELHDELGQMLTAIKMDAVSLQRDTPAALKAKAENVIRLVDATMDSVRRIAADLRPAMLDDLGLIAALEWLTESCSGSCTCQCGMVIKGEPYELTPEVNTAVFRIVQEAYTNIMKHAAARHSGLELVYGEQALSVIVEDDGKGLDANATFKEHAFGLLGIKERALGVGGTARIGSTPTGGARLEVNIPISERETCAT